MPPKGRRPQPEIIEPEDASAQQRLLQLVPQSELHATHVAEVMHFLRNHGFDFNLEAASDDETTPRTLH